MFFRGIRFLLYVSERVLIMRCFLRKSVVLVEQFCISAVVQGVTSLFTEFQIKGGIKAVQEHIIQKDDRLSRALIPVGSLHITLLVTYLGSEEEVSV